jgi:hypothetical protein
LGEVVKGRFKHGSKQKNPPVNTEVERKPKLETGGNSRPDADWLLEMDEDIAELTKEQAAALDVPWDVKYQFSGYSDEVNPEFFEFYRRGNRKCTGAAYVRDERGGYVVDLDGVRIMRPCLRPPILGATVCPKHGGEIGHVKKAAQTRLAMASENAATTLIELSAPYDKLGVPVEQAQRIKAAAQVLDRVGIRAGVEVEVMTPGYQQVLNELFGDGEAEGDGA